MSDPVDTHFDQDGLLRAVIDETDLSEAQRVHLKRCAACRARIGKFKDDLAWLGLQARQSAPRPQRRITVPRKSSTRRVRPLSFGLAAASAVVLVLVFTWWWDGGGKEDFIKLRQPTYQIEELAVNDAEIQAQSEAVLPDVYLDMLGEEESGISDEFLEYVSPLPEPDDDFLDGYYKQKEIDYA